MLVKASPLPYSGWLLARAAHTGFTVRCVPDGCVVTVAVSEQGLLTAPHLSDGDAAEAQNLIASAGGNQDLP